MIGTNLMAYNKMLMVHVYAQKLGNHKLYPRLPEIWLPVDYHKI